MKFFNLRIPVFLIFISSISFSQTFQAGIKLDAERLSTSHNEFPSSHFQVRTAYLTGTYFLWNDLAFEARMGYNWEDYYSGAEAGLFSKYYYKDVYTVFGIVYHHINNEITDNIDQNYFPTETDLLMPALGLGFNPGRHFAFELMFQHGLNKKIGYYNNWALLASSLYHPLSELSPDIKLKWIMKIGMSYSFSF